MALDLSSILYTAVILAVAGGLYGMVITLVWSPFLLSGRIRHLFASIPPADWRVSYLAWMPVPAVVWGFFAGAVLPISRAFHPSGKASPLYISGVDSIVVATIISMLLWPTLLLVVLPGRGFEWYDDDNRGRAVALVVVGAVWYFLWLVAPTYVVTIFAGFGDSFSAT